MTTDSAQGWVAIPPRQCLVKLLNLLPWSTRSVLVPAMIPLLLSKPLGIRYSSLEDGVVAASKMIELSLLIWILFSKQVLSTHLPAPFKTEKRMFAALFTTFNHKGASASVWLCFLLT